MTEVSNGYVANCKKYNKLVASMSSLMHCFPAIAGSIREKIKMDMTRPPLKDILVKYVFELRRTCPTSDFI